MAITQSGQQILNRTGSDSNHNIVHVLFSDQTDVDDQVADVVGWMQNNLSTSYLGQDFASANYAEIGSGWWSVTASYSTEESDEKDKSDQPEIDEESDWKFSIATESKNVKLSKSLASVTPANNDWNAFIGMPFPINYSKGELQGVDIPVPVAAWEETYYLNPTVVTQGYRLNCLSLVGKVNVSTFRGAAAKQVLLQSVEGNRKAATPWVITFSFLYRANHTATYRMTDGKNRSVTTVGHQIIDARYGKGKFAGITYEIPRVIFVQDVFESGDFSLLGIGS